eukprot:6272187-Pyramimonas_sp.AAC.1
MAIMSAHHACCHTHNIPRKRSLSLAATNRSAIVTPPQSLACRLLPRRSRHNPPARHVSPFCALPAFDAPPRML